MIAHSNFIVVTTSSFSVHLRTSENVLETGDSLWHGALELVKYLLQHPEVVRHRRVIELGAGTGLVGIVAAALGAASVTITDLECQQTLLQQNIDMNQALWMTDPSPISETSCDSNDIESSAQSSSSICFRKVVAKVHRFGEFPQEDWISERGPFDVILASDIGYDIELLEPAAQSICNFMRRDDLHSIAPSPSPSPCQAVLVEEVRWKDIYGWYKEALVKHRCARGLRSLVETEIESHMGQEARGIGVVGNTDNGTTLTSSVRVSIMNSDGTLLIVPLSQQACPIMLLSLS